MKASLTVEAAYIFPFCFIVIGVICCLGIYEYNQAVLKMTGYECVLEIMGQEDMGEDVFRQSIMNKAKRAAESRALAVKDLEVNVKMTISKISVTYCCTQTLLNLPVEVTVIYERTFPELTLRLR